MLCDCRQSRRQTETVCLTEVGFSSIEQGRMVPSNQLLAATAWKRSFACVQGKGVDLKRRAERGSRWKMGWTIWRFGQSSAYSMRTIERTEENTRPATKGRRNG